MKANLILSIDRRNTSETAMQVVDLAHKYQSRGVVGIDLVSCYIPSTFKLVGEPNILPSAALNHEPHSDLMFFW